jgi:hypothetical protein
MPLPTQSILKTLAFGAAIAGANVLFEGAQKLKSKMAKDPAFKRMMEMHPPLQKMDPNEVVKYWDNLYHFAPKMAQEPLAAGAYILQVSRMADFGGPTSDTIKTLSEIQDKSGGGEASFAPPTESKIFMNAISTMARLPGTPDPSAPATAKHGLFGVEE